MYADGIRKQESNDQIANRNIEDEGSNECNTQSEQSTEDLFSDGDEYVPDDDELSTDTSRKRERNCNGLKRRKAAIKRARGESYVSQNGETGQEKVQPNTRVLLFGTTYLATYRKSKSVKVLSVHCNKLAGKKVDVIKSYLQKGLSASPPDKRGHHENRPHKIEKCASDYIIEHIKEFPSKSSRYSRNINPHRRYLSPLMNLSKIHRFYTEKCVANYLPDKFKAKRCSYSRIFTTEFNLLSRRPRSDTHSLSDAGGLAAHYIESLLCIYISCGSTIREYILYRRTQRKQHFSSAQKKLLIEIEMTCVALHISTLIEFHQTVKQNDHLVNWTDSCAVLEGMFKAVKYKFPEVDHMYLDSDRDFGRIEKNLRCNEVIFVLEQYRTIIA
ncbi:hypothetical protein PR048_023845 [Dryococelus australis]|uniref:Uncharacterized protein n=1 Tax=Dryococelus australis TaxID=614101 RepID=A0ABQ9GV85_9NEOP|nr:hypothetical protein PR048_023845 [Dryococelus australis]